MKVPHHLSKANVAELSQALSVRHFEIITSIIKRANYCKKGFANSSFKSFDIYPHNLSFLNLFWKRLSILILDTFDLMLKSSALRPYSIWRTLYLSGSNIKKKKSTVTKDLLKEMASVFWDKLPQYERQPKSKFSIGWLEGFKACQVLKNKSYIEKQKQLIWWQLKKNYRKKKRQLSSMIKKLSTI